MAIDLVSSIRIISEDQVFFEELINELMRQRRTHQGRVQRIIEEIIVASMADERGYLKPGALTDSDMDRLENDLIALYSEEELSTRVEDALTVVDARLLTIDDLMQSLELESSVLGEEVFEFEFVEEGIERMIDSYVTGAYGDEPEDIDGSVEKIREAAYRYRFNRDEEEHILREDLVREMEVAGNFGENNANTIVITEMASIDRELKRVQAERSGIEHGLYSGIHDDIIRPFCDVQLGLIKPYSEWDEMYNDMPEDFYDHPVSFHCGGYNCRHRIVPYDLMWSDGVTNLRHEFVHDD